MPPESSPAGLAAAEPDLTSRPRRRRKSGPVPGNRHPGMWQPGQSGNPSGRPKRTEAQRTFAQLVKEASPRAAEILVECMEDPKATWKERQNAALALIEHSEGKAVDRIQVANIDGTGGNVRSLPKDVLDQKVANLLAESAEIEGDCVLIAADDKKALDL